MVKKDKTREFVINPTHLSPSEAYLVQGDLTPEEMRHLKVAWGKLWGDVDRKPSVLVVPEHVKLETMPTGLLKELMARLETILKEREQ